jgi:cysteine-rich repeat protein
MGESMKTSTLAVIVFAFLCVISGTATAKPGGDVLPGCGNKVVTGDEQCDDANNLDGDGCSASCVIEEDWTCEGSPSVCKKNSATVAEPELVLEAKSELVYQLEPQYELEEFNPQYAAAHVPAEYCGDGILQTHRGEQCDDGNKVEDDGCNSSCQKTAVRIQRINFPGWNAFDFLKLNL